MTPPQIALTFCMRKETVMAACTAELQYAGKASQRCWQYVSGIFRREGIGANRPLYLRYIQTRYRDGRHMSRAGKPTDNPVNEALNGWIKEELFIDFRLEECRTRDAVKDVLCRYVDFYNRQRPCFAIGYDTPDNYCKRFYRGELEKKDTFSKRILTEEPKFVQKRKDTEK